jgi:hypothetical protein
MNPKAHNGSFRWFTRFGVYTATPWAFVIVIAYGIAWAVFGQLDFGGVATLAVWTMTLFIQARSIGTRRRCTQSWTSCSAFKATPGTS